MFISDFALAGYLDRLGSSFEKQTLDNVFVLSDHLSIAGFIKSENVNAPDKATKGKHSRHKKKSMQHIRNKALKNG